MSSQSSQCFSLAGEDVCPGTEVYVVDARGRGFRGFIKSISGAYIVLSSECNGKPSVFIKQSRVAYIVVVGSCQDAEVQNQRDPKGSINHPA